MAEDTKPSFLGLLNGIALAEEGAGVFLSAWAVRALRHCQLLHGFCIHGARRPKPRLLPAPHSLGRTLTPTRLTRAEDETSLRAPGPPRLRCTATVPDANISSRPGLRFAQPLSPPGTAPHGTHTP